MFCIKLKLLFTVLVFSTFYASGSALFSLNDSTISVTSNGVPTGAVDSNNVKKDTTHISRRDAYDDNRNDSTYRPFRKKDKRGELSFTVGWINRDAYLGSYYISPLSYGYAELRYKFWFGLFGAISPQFLFNLDSAFYVGSNLSVGFDNEWFRNFHVSFSYTYSARQESSVEALQDLWGNDFDVYAYYANKILTPEIRYDLTFGSVTGISIKNLTSPGRINVAEHDNVINVGLSHTFIICDGKRGGDFSIKIGDNANFGTANALLTKRALVPDDNSGGYQYVDVPFTGDQFGPLNNETNLTIFYTWGFISISPYITFSVPFRNFAAEQAALGAVNVNGVQETPEPDIVTKDFFYGGVSLELKYPGRKIKKRD